MVQRPGSGPFSRPEAMNENSAGMLLFAVLALPFVGSVIAGLLRANSRNADAWLAGSISLIGLVLVSTSYPRVADGNVVKAKLEWVPELGLDFTREDGRFRLGVRDASHRHRPPRGALRALLHVAVRSGAALLLVPARVHGRDARHRAVGQPHPARLLLGADEPLLVPADRLLASDRPSPRRRANGFDHHVSGRALPLRRRAGDRAHRRQLRPRPGAGLGRRRSGRIPFISRL